MLEGVRKHPMVKKAFAAGEERVGRLVTQLLSNQKFVSGVQTLVASAISAKGSLDKSLKRALGAMNVPTSDDLEGMQRKLQELESSVAAITDRLGKLEG
jgi:hypothetical protein